MNHFFGRVIRNEMFVHQILDIVFPVLVCVHKQYVTTIVNSFLINHINLCGSENLSFPILSDHR